MTVSVDDQARLSYAGNGQATQFPTPYFLANGHISVLLRGVTGSETAWVENTQYTLSGAGAPGGGTVTVLTSPTDHTPQSGETLVIRRSPPIEQGVAFLEGGEFAASTIERSLDILTMLVKQQAEALDRTPQLATTSPTTGVTLPEPEEGEVMLWDSQGNLVNSGLMNAAYTGISTYGRSLIDDADAATARGTLGLGSAATRNVGAAIGDVTMLENRDGLAGLALDRIDVGPPIDNSPNVAHRIGGRIQVATATTETVTLRSQLWVDDAGGQSSGNLAISCIDADVFIGYTNANNWTAPQIVPINAYFDTRPGSAGKISTVRMLQTSGVIEGATVGTLSHLHANEFTGAASIDVQYGVFLPLFSKAAANWGVYVTGNRSFQGSGMLFGNTVGGHTRSFRWVGTENIAGVTSWATVKTIAFAQVSNVWTRGLVTYTVAGHSDASGNGTRSGTYYFDVTNGAPTVGAVGTDVVSGASPQFRLAVSGNDVLIQVQSYGGVNGLSGSISLEIDCPNSAGTPIIYTIS